jgi:tetratricopeptide (TPR) repeat protein
MSICPTNGDRDDHEEKHDANDNPHTGGDIHELHDFFLDAGVLSERSGDLPAALDLYEQAIKSSPESALAWYNYGDILLALERFEEAVPALRKAVERSPKTNLFHYDLGLALFHLGRHDEASKEFAAIIASDPQLKRASSDLHLSSMTNLALCQDELGHSREAAKVLAPAERTAVNILYNLGRINYRAKRMDAALSFARAAELLTPKSEEVVHLVGSILMETKRKAEAVEVLLRATKLNPRCSYAWYDLGVTLTRLKQNQKARPYFQKALRLNPTYGWTYYCLACLDALERKTDAAFANLGLAIVHGFHNAAHLRRDSDLRSLRRDSRWKTFVTNKPINAANRKQ